MDPQFMTILQALRDLYGETMIVDSGWRCQEHNASKEVGGSPRSMHLLGRAADILATNLSSRVRLIETARAVGFNGLGIGSTFVHLDNRTLPATWTYPIKKHG